MTLPKRKVIRAQRHDYTSPGGYFVTICTHDRHHYFGEITNQVMHLNPLGQYTHTYTQSLSRQRKTVIIDEYIIMPNHIHILLIMNHFLPSFNKPITNTRRDDFLRHPDTHTIQRISEKSEQKNLLDRSIYNPQYQGPTLGSIVNMFKGAITKYANSHDVPFKRQSRYHDQIIRDQRHYENVKQYIRKNLENRKEDGFHTP